MFPETWVSLGSDCDFRHKLEPCVNESSCGSYLIYHINGCCREALVANLWLNKASISSYTWLIWKDTSSFPTPKVETIPIHLCSLLGVQSHCCFHDRVIFKEFLEHFYVLFLSITYSIYQWYIGIAEVLISPNERLHTHFTGQFSSKTHLFT